MLDPVSLELERSSCLAFAADLPTETLNWLLANFTGWEKISDAAEILYAVRDELTPVWHDHLIHLLQFISVNGFDLPDGGRLRGPAMLAEVITPSEHPPAPSPRFVPIVEDEGEE